MSPTFNASDSECHIFTYKEGLLSSVAHDLKLKVTSLKIDITDDLVTASFDPRSIRVVCAMKGGVEQPDVLSEKDRLQIEENMRRDVLASDRHPAITFRSRGITREGERIRVTGDLQIRDKTMGMTLDARQTGGRFVADAEFSQSDFGIKPFSAMFGAIKIKAQVRVTVSVPAPR